MVPHYRYCHYIAQIPPSNYDILSSKMTENRDFFQF